MDNILVAFFDHQIHG